MGVDRLYALEEWFFRLKCSLYRFGALGSRAPALMNELLDNQTFMTPLEPCSVLIEGALRLLTGRQPTVSVIVPSWNRAHTICRAIRSALDQFFPPLEIIVCDDGSDDLTRLTIHAAFAAALSERKVVYLHHETNRGVSAARNTALAAARGEFIAYLDSDNYWHPSHLLFAICALLQNRNRECAYTAFRRTEIALKRTTVIGASFDRKRILNENYIDLNTIVHARSLYEKYGGFDLTLTRLVDWDLILRYSLHTIPFYVPLITVNYFLDKESLCNLTYEVALQPNFDIIKERFSRTENGPGQSG